MAKAELIKATGSVQEIEPKNGTDFSLEELKTIVDGYIQVVWLKDGRIMVVNEEGKIHRLPLNVRATCIVNGEGIADTIVGNVLICRSEMVK